MDYDQVIICKFFGYPRSCIRGTTCRYLHVTPNAANMNLWTKRTTEISQNQTVPSSQAIGASQGIAPQMMGAFHGETLQVMGASHDAAPPMMSNSHEVAPPSKGIPHRESPPLPRLVNRCKKRSTNVLVRINSCVNENENGELHNKQNNKPQFSQTESPLNQRVFFEERLLV